MRSIERFVSENEIPFMRFAKGRCKEDLAATYIASARAQGRHGVAQEKESVWRGWREAMRGGSGEPTRGRAVLIDQFATNLRDRPPCPIRAIDVSRVRQSVDPA